MLKKFAADLKKQRENKNISLADIAAKTRVHISILEKIEQGDFSFYGPTYVRAFIRQYAKAARLDPEEVLFSYELAKSGKYSSRTTEADTKFTAEKQEEKTEPEDTESSFVTVYGKTGTTEPLKPPEEEHFNKKRFSRSKRIKIEADKSYTPSKQRRTFNIPVSFFKNAGVVLLVLMLIFAVYMLVKILFLDKGNDNVEVVRQKFSDVVEENERKILGKRTEQEISDSIRKANEYADSLKRASQDSLTLILVGRKKGKLNVYVDTVLVQSLWKENFSEGDSGVYRAKTQFFLTSENTSEFKAYLNGKPLKINKQKVDRIRITRQGINN